MQACECRSLRRPEEGSRIPGVKSREMPSVRVENWTPASSPILSPASHPFFYFFKQSFSPVAAVQHSPLHQSADIFTSLAGLDCTPSLLEEGGLGGSCDLQVICSYQSPSVIRNSALTAYNIDLGAYVRVSIYAAIGRHIHVGCRLSAVAPA